MTDPSTDPVGTVRRETFDSGYSVYAYLPLHSPVWDDHKNRWTCIYSTHAGNVGEDLGGTEVEWLRENAPVIGAVPGTPAAEQEETGHVIEIRDDGWTIMHPLSCRLNLFECEVNRAAGSALTTPPMEPGRYPIELRGSGLFIDGSPVQGYPYRGAAPSADDIFEDLAARLAAADISWGMEHGDPPANPDYIRCLARQVAAFKPSYLPTPARCPSCEHRLSMHTFEGCVQEIAHGPHDEPDVCPCVVTAPGGYGEGK